jgi:hypothetical protein
MNVLCMIPVVRAQIINNGISSKHRLSSLVLANNALVDLHAASLAEALRTIRHLLRLDPAGPFITKKGITSDPIKYVAAR